MTALIALTAIALFAAGVIAGIIGVVSVAIRREERNLTLTSQATDNVSRAGRWLNGVYVRAPRHTAAAGRQPTLV
jgi:protein-S-isoprenylcysteine O-methyltransferase Ste14